MMTAKMNKKFSPLEDITAYELAQIVGCSIFKGAAMMDGPIYFEDWADLDISLRRHFVDFE